MGLKLNSFYGRESENLEFKEFCIKYNKNNLLSKELIIDIIENNYWHENINHLVKYNIKEYIEYLLPKYITCFSNASINGKLVIGVNDYGEITGIPLQKDTNINFLKEKIQESIISTLKDNVYSKVSNLEKYVNFDIKKLVIDKNLLNNNDEIQELYDKYCTDKIRINDILSEYYESKMNWLKQITCYSTKLSKIINTRKTRNELIEYIRIRNKNKENCEELISQLQSDKIICIPRGIELFKIMENKNSMMYWLTEYKDHMVRLIIDKKPIKPSNVYCLSISNLFLRLTPSMNRFVNHGIDYYIIEISLNMKGTDNEMLYKYPNSHKWVNRCRTTIDGNPCCY